MHFPNGRQKYDWPIHIQSRAIGYTIFFYKGKYLDTFSFSDFILLFVYKTISPNFRSLHHNTHLDRESSCVHF